MTDDDQPKCPECGYPLMAVSPWWYVCRKLTCGKRVPRYDWVEEDGNGEEDDTGNDDLDV